jgi:transcriptional regulator with XRE-family HTH domain
MGVSKAQEKEYARILYVSERITYKEIAERVGVTEKTIGRWAEIGNWDKLRKSLLTTRDNQLVHWYNQLENINEDIAHRPVLQKDKKGDDILRVEKIGIPTSAEADTMSKLSGNIQKLETEIGLGEYVTVSKKLLVFIQGIDLGEAKRFKNYIDEFINEKLKNG